jgi:uncharacterized membrane protein
MPSDSSRRADLPSAERLLTLSDGVVAIALTLLVLQLTVPAPTPGNHYSAAGLGHDLVTDGGAQLISYLISYYVIAQFWLVHHRVFRQIAGQREGLAWWNFAFLLTITVMPFTSDLLGRFSENPLAVDIFAVNLLLATLATQATLVYGRRNEMLTAAAAANARELAAGRARAAASALVIAASIGVAWVNTSAAKYCWLLLAVAPQVADRWTGRHGRAAAQPGPGARAPGGEPGDPGSKPGGAGSG